MSSPDELREKATYIIFSSHVRPVEESDGVNVVLTYAEYRIVRQTVEWVQRLGTMPVPILRLARKDDVPIKSIVGLKRTIRHLSGFCKGKTVLPTFNTVCIPSSSREVPLGVEDTLNITEKALKELEVKS